MKYLSSYKLFENVQKAKSILNSLDINLDDERYKELTKLLQKNPGYIGDFTELIFKKNWNLNSVSFIYQNWILPQENNALFKKLSKKLVDYKNEEELLDELNSLRNEHLIKKILNEFPSEQKSLTNEWPDSIKRKLLYNLAIRKDKANFLNKISRYKTTKGLYTALKGFVEAKTTEGHEKTLKAVMSTGAKIMHNNESENIIIALVDYKQLLNLCSHTSWCIKSEGTFYSYNKVARQYVIFLTDMSGNESMIGATIGLKFRTAHYINDEYVSETQLRTILSKRGFNLDSLKIPKEEWDKEVIRKEDVQKLLRDGYDLEAILKVRGNKLSQSDFTFILFNKDTLGPLNIEANIRKLKKLGVKFDLFGRIMNPNKNSNIGIEESDDLINQLFNEGLIDRINWNQQRLYKKLGDKVLPHLDWKGEYIPIDELELYDKAKVIEPKTFNHIKELIDYDSRYLAIISLVEFLEKEGIEYPDDEIVKKVKEQISNYSDAVVADFLRIRPDLFFKFQDKMELSVISSSTLQKILDFKYYPEDSSAMWDLRKWINNAKLKEFKKFLKDIIPQVGIMNRNSRRADEYARKIGVYDQKYGFTHKTFLHDSIWGEIKRLEFNNVIRTGSWSNKDDYTLLVMTFISLTKEDRLNEVKDIRLNYNDLGRIIRQAMWRPGSNFGYFYNGGPFLAEPFQLTDDEEERLFNFLLQNYGPDKLSSGIGNHIYDKELERHKAFSLVYYKWGWGFNKYFSLIQKVKPMLKDKWSKIDGRDHVIYGRNRPEYFEHIFDYLKALNKKEELLELMGKIYNNMELKKYEVYKLELEVTYYLKKVSSSPNTEIAKYISGFKTWDKLIEETK
jgi:hypothetical protein